MPIFKARWNYKKFYRPDGMRYAHGKTLADIGEAVDSAFEAFKAEFGCEPRQEETNLEVMGVTGGWSATVLEIKEDFST